MPPPQKLVILAQLRALLPHTSHKFVISAVGTLFFCLVLAAVFAASSGKKETSAPVLAETSAPATAGSAPSEVLPSMHTTDIRAGDTIVAALRRVNVADAALMTFLQTPAGGRFVRSFRIGSRIEAMKDAENQLMSVLVRRQHSEKAVQLTPEDATYTLKEISLPVERRVKVVSGRVDSSLFGIMDEQGLPDSLAISLADIFSDQIDFRIGLHKDDPYSFVYEAFYYQGKLLNTGKILAANFSHNGKNTTALWYGGKNGRAEGYYSPEGRSLHRSFLRTPVAYTRISSKFSTRLHPILHKWRHHNGTDFAAPTGTPVKASADGVVEFVGRRHGYGNFVLLHHGNGISTGYGHLSRFAKNLRRGQHVQQGRVIAYVGSTGLATGPHLHYEFRVNGRPVDPLKVKLPRPSLTARLDLKAFHQKTASALALLDVPGEAVATVATN